MMRKLLALAMLSFFVACGDDTTSPSSANLAGTYTLVSVNGATLPIVVQAANPKIELVSEQLVVNSNGGFTITTTRRSTPTTGAVTSATTTDAGTYSSSGSTTTFQFNSGNKVTATLSGNTLTLSAGTSSSVYTK
jgi:hypothetical protein